MNQSTLNLMPIKSTDSILEIGFGGGGLIKMILDQNDYCLVHGVDISPAMVTYCEKKLKTHINASRLRLNCASVTALPHASSSLDKVCSVNSLYFWPGIKESLSEIKRVLISGGMLVICIETKASMQRHACTRYDFQLLEATEIKNCLETAGFKQLNIQVRQSKSSDYLTITGQK